MKLLHRRGASAVLIGVLAISAAACGKSSSGSGDGGGGSFPKTITLGEVIPLTGPYAELGEMHQLGAQMAADEINAAGGIKNMGGAKIKLVVRDAGTQVSESVWP